jgi:cytoplasmic iron level regulating protein YaaA (DUF328/UPF0246 family)
MLFLLSPAKSLDYETPMPQPLPHSLPSFPQRSQELISVLKQKSPQDIAQLMHLSDALASLNVARYQTWSPRFTAKNSRQAAFAFNGDVYDGLEIRSLNPEDWAWAQDHLAILSGLYGVLRPLDWMQAYRLEMGTALVTERGKDLYQFWGSDIATHLNQRLHEVSHHNTPAVVVNLASQEYFKAVQKKTLNADIVDCVFEDCKAGQYKIISFFAKRARGLMARYAIQNRVTQVAQLKSFDLAGYRFSAAASEPRRLVFRRDEPTP